MQHTGLSESNQMGMFLCWSTMRYSKGQKAVSSLASVLAIRKQILKLRLEEGKINFTSFYCGQK